MRIFVSAYACDPTRGSEPGVGWNWALEIQRQGNDTVVMTRVFNKPKIEKYYAENPKAPRPKFVYFELSDFWLRLFQKRILPEQIYYFLWQIYCVDTARKAVAENNSDFVWHLTMGSMRQPSFLWRLGKPFVIGPAGGGERAPYAMRTDYPWVGHIWDNLRDGLNWISRIDPTVRASFAHASLILSRTPESAKLVAKKWRHKVKICHEVGVVNVAPSSVTRTQLRRVLYAGGLTYWKGITLAVRAFAAFIRLGGEARFTMVGSGKQEGDAKQVAKELEVDHLIDWVPWVERSEMDRFYREHDVFLFPSLHDSGGTVVVEAMSHGLPVLCLDLGGPGQIVSPTAGVVHSTFESWAHEVAADMGVTMKRLYDDPAEFKRLSAGALAHAEEFRWSYRVARALSEIQKAGIVPREQTAPNLRAQRASIPATATRNR